MKKLNLIWLILIHVVTSCTDSFDASQKVYPLSELKCYKTFEEFAYTDFIQSSEKWLPAEPWQIQATMPNEYSGDDVLWEVQLVRYVNSNPEIWFMRRGGIKSEVPRILIYYPKTNSWMPISAVVEESDTLVSELYLTNEGNILGKNYWFTAQDGSSNHGTILSKYNEQTNQFEFVPRSPLISSFKGEKPTDIRTLFDDVNDVFWVVLDDGLYAYEQVTDKTTKLTSLQGISIGTLASATDGTIFFTNVTNEPEQPNFDPRLYEGFLMKFSPKSGEIIELDISDEPWPTVGVPIVTKSDKLWIGSIGFLDLIENRWSLLTDPSEYYVGGFISWPTSPQVILEDDSGTVWFELISETRGSGMAWYDPDTGDGCMFTNASTNIVEDEQQQLWIFADGKLYRLSPVSEG